MTIQEKLKKAFQAFLEDNTEEVQMGEAVLADGRAIMWEGDLAEGVAVMQMPTEEGAEPIALEDGEYSLEDGTVFTMAGGVVETVVPAAEGDAFDADKFTQEIMAKIDAKVEEKIQELLDNGTFMKVDEVEAKLKEQSGQVEKLATSVLAALAEEKKPAPTKKPNKETSQRSPSANAAIQMGRAILGDKN